jgi:hypothetical protein
VTFEEEEEPSRYRVTDYIFRITKGLSLCKSVSLLVIMMFSLSRLVGRILSIELARLQRAHGANCDATLLYSVRADGHVTVRNGCQCDRYTAVRTDCIAYKSYAAKEMNAICPY